MPYESEGTQAVGSTTNTSTNTSTNTGQSSNVHTVSTQPTEVENYEDYDEFEHLNQNNPSPPTALPPRKHKRLRNLQDKVLAFIGLGQKH